MRRKVEIGYARGTETRDRILNVAIQLFGNYGFDSVTTREIAAQSDVPPASLRYYFVNKEGLYIACLEHVQTLTFKLLEGELEATEALLAQDNVDADRLIESFCAMQDARIDSLMGGPDNGAAALFTIRHDLPSTGGAGKLGSMHADARRMMNCYLQVLSRISGNTRGFAIGTDHHRHDFRADRQPVPAPQPIGRNGLGDNAGTDCMVESNHPAADYRDTEILSGLGSGPKREIADYLTSAKSISASLIYCKRNRFE